MSIDSVKLNQNFSVVLILTGRPLSYFFFGLFFGSVSVSVCNMCQIVELFFNYGDLSVSLANQFLLAYFRFVFARPYELFHGLIYFFYMDNIHVIAALT